MRKFAGYAGRSLVREVAKNQPRLYEQAADRRVTAHGTAFDVRLEGHNRIEVTLVEGRVSVIGSVAAWSGTYSPVDHEELLPGEH